MKSLNKIAMTFILGLFMSSCGEAAKDGQVVLKENNTIVLSDEVNAMTVAKVLEQARDLDSKLKKGEPLYLILNTPGGSVSDGLELVDMLKGMDRKVHTITIFAASMGFQIAQQMNDRLMIGSGTLMSHKARGAVRGEFGGDEPSQLDSRLNLWKSKIKNQRHGFANRKKNKRQTDV